ncbi:MAG: peptide chain release factor aRF-1, partial [Nanoarchaeota archaeon]|nr:peptide chain release factor aRF-1 [Nanoarchaeota archaeon]
EKIINEIRLINQPPKNGLIIFCGNISDKEGEPDIRLWSLEPPIKSDIRIYRCDQRFVTEPLKEMLNKGKAYGLLVMDHREATIGLLDGPNITVLKHMKSMVPGKFSKGGQSAMRFTREREGLIRDFYREVGESLKSLLSDKNISGIIVGGSGPAKDNFVESSFFPSQFKLLGVKNVGYTDESGLEELINKSQDILADERIVIEREYVQRLMKSIADNDHMAVYGEDQTRAELEKDNVDILLLSNGLPEDKKSELYYMGVDHKAQVEFISSESSDGSQLYSLGGVAALLRKPSSQF